MAKRQAAPKTRKGSDDLILLAGILLFFAGAYMFFLAQGKG
jgi:hypothetical protein